MTYKHYDVQTDRFIEVDGEEKIRLLEAENDAMRRKLQAFFDLMPRPIYK